MADNNSEISILLKKAIYAVKEGEWSRATLLCNKVLSIDPNSSYAYLGKLMAELHTKDSEDLRNLEVPFDDNDNYLKICQLDPKLEKKLDQYNEAIYMKMAESYYQNALKVMRNAVSEKDYIQAAHLFDDISGYKDSDDYKKSCLEHADKQKRAFSDSSSYYNTHRYSQNNVQAQSENRNNQNNVYVQREDKNPVKTITYITGLLTFYIKGKIIADRNSITFKIPNTILKFIPCGSKTEQFTVNQIANVTTNKKFSFLPFFLGTIIIMSGFTFLVAPAASNDVVYSFIFFLFYLAIGIIVLTYSWIVRLVIKTTSGEEKSINFILFEKKKVDLAKNIISEMISGRLNDTNVSDNTDRLIDTINRGRSY